MSSQRPSWSWSYFPTLQRRKVRLCRAEAGRGEPGLKGGKGDRGPAPPLSQRWPHTWLSGGSTPHKQIFFMLPAFLLWKANGSSLATNYNVTGQDTDLGGMSQCTRWHPHSWFPSAGTWPLNVFALGLGWPAVGTTAQNPGFSLAILGITLTKQ